MDADALACVIFPILQALHGEVNTVRVEQARDEVGEGESLVVGERVFGEGPSGESLVMPGLGIPA